MTKDDGPSPLRVAVVVVLVALVAVYLMATVAILTSAEHAGRFVYSAIAAAIVGLATLAVLWAFPRLRGSGEARSPALVRCPRCATTFTPPLRASSSTCPTCGLVAGFDDSSRNP